MNRIKKIFLAGCVLVPSMVNAQMATVTADFGLWTDYPLVKKIGVYETPLVTRDWLARDVPKLSEIESRCFRYEFAWGKDLYTSRDISGSVGSMKYDWDNSDYLFDLVAEHSPAIVFCHGYTPQPLFSTTGSLAWQAPPSDMAKWREVNKVATAHWKEKGYSNRYVEVWNEPDLPGGFFSGTVDDYVRIYEQAALGARDADSDAKVGGPGGALQWWHIPLVEHCLKVGAPLDFISGHAYGKDFKWQLNAMREAINKLGNRGAEMLLTEYSPYPAAEYAAHGPVERAEAAMTFFQALPTMLQYTDLTYVTWAQFIDPQAGTSGKAFDDWDKLGLVDGNYGFRKSLFNAFKLYGMMPADRCSVSLPTNSDLGAMASSSGDCSAMVIWNPSDKTYKVKSVLRRLAFDRGRLQVYNIDEKTNSWYETGDDELRATMDSIVDVDGGTKMIVLQNLEVRPRGVLFVKVEKENAAPLFPVNDFAKVVRTDQWYEQTRSNTAPYALFDSKTWTARLSTCNKADGTAIVGVTAEDLPEYVRVTSKSTTLVDRNANSAQGVRFDFMSDGGKYVSSVVFHGGIYHNDERTTTLPWGTGRKVDKVVKVDDFSDFTFKLADYVPAGFSGRALITFELSATGANSKCNIQLHRPDHFMVSDLHMDSIGQRYVATSVEFTGDAANIAKAGLVFAAGSDPITRKAITLCDTLAEGFFRTTLDRLMPNKDYYFRGVVVTNDGDTIFTPMTVASTRANPCRLSVQSVDCDTVALTADVSCKILSAPTEVYRRGFVWSRRSDTPNPTMADNVVTMTSKGTGVYKSSLTGLEPATEYAVRAYAFSQAGTTLSDPFYFSTNPGVTAIDDVMQQGVYPVATYDIGGRRVENPAGGVFVTRYSDGTIRKQILP